MVMARFLVILAHYLICRGHTVTKGLLPFAEYGIMEAAGATRLRHVSEFLQSHSPETV